MKTLTSKTDSEFERYHGWSLLAHPHLEDQLSKWSNEVIRLAKRQPDSYREHFKTKRLATLMALIFDIVPSEPNARLWLQRNTLGEANQAWRRAKCLGQYRLFFRFDSKSKVIVYGWVNDENSLRAYERRNEAYLVFARRLEANSPPSDWHATGSK